MSYGRGSPLPACLALSCLLAGCAYLGRRATIIYGTVEAAFASDTVAIQLQRSFIEAYKNRITITVNFTVDDTRDQPWPKFFDGDLHFTGRAPGIGFAIVSEVKNASKEDAALKLLQQAESTHVAVRLTGMWRIWPEHAHKPKQEQGKPMDPLESTTPDHVFEIHPAIRLGPMDLLGTLHPVGGYKPGSAGRTFKIYQDASCTIRVGPKIVTIVTPTGLYNDVHFIMQLTGQRQVVAGDGRFVTASALDLDGKLLVPGLRMIFIKGSPPEAAVRVLPPGSRLHVWGMPRIDFVEISRRVRESRGNPSLLEGPLPYELVILGVYPEEK